jgi:hypothetical protein
MLWGAIGCPDPMVMLPIRTARVGFRFNSTTTSPPDEPAAPPRSGGGHHLKTIPDSGREGRIAARAVIAGYRPVIAAASSTSTTPS